MRFILKAKKMYEGTITTWADGTRHKKVAGKWKLVGGVGRGQGGAIGDTRAEKHYGEALKIAWAGLGIVEHLEDKYKVQSFTDLKAALKGKPRDQASKIFRSTKDYVDALAIPTGNKAAAIDRLGRAIIRLRDKYSIKNRLTVTKKLRTGRTKWVSKNAPQPSFKPTAVRTAKALLGGWTKMSSLPTAAQMTKMLANGTSVLASGTHDLRKKWHVYQSLSDVLIPFKGSEKGITVGMRQIKQGKQRTVSTAVVNVTIPYAYARQFLEKHIKSLRTRNDLVGQLTRSAGYKKAVARKRKRVA